MLFLVTSVTNKFSYVPRFKWFEFLQSLLVYNDTKFELGILILVILWFIDWITGLIKAAKTRTIDSDTGKDGFIKHGTVILLLIIFIPISIVFGDMGISALWIAYTTYMINEVISILENLSQAGVNIGPLENFMRQLTSKDK